MLKAVKDEELWNYNQKTEAQNDNPDQDGLFK
jgi:hypothetical protein